MEAEGKSCGTGMSGEKKCCCPCHCLPGVLVALIGVDILLGDHGVISASLADNIWPALLILIGLYKAFIKGKCKCCRKR